MDQKQYSTLVEALKEVPDPRQARGKRHEWALILSLIASALASGQLNGRAMSQWVREHESELVAHLQPWRGTLPSEATLRRALRRVDVIQLEAAFAAFRPTPAKVEEEPRPTPKQPPKARVRALAADGKVVRGVGRYGKSLALVSLVEHDSARTVAQQAIGNGQSEQSTLPALLAQQPLAECVITMDALHTTRSLAEQLISQGGHYFMTVKRNQPVLYEALETVFTLPPWQPHGAAPEHAQDRQVTKGHGRLEWRTVESTTALNTHLDWPALQQVLRRHARRVRLATGEVTDEVTYALTSLPRQCADVRTLAQIWRGHWTIENRLHYVRDVTLGEDACRIRLGAAPQALAALRNALLSLLRAHGWHRIPDALRHYAAAVPRALRLIGAIS